MYTTLHYTLEVASEFIFDGFKTATFLFCIIQWHLLSIERFNCTALVNNISAFYVII